MRTEWQRKTLGEVCIVERGSSPRPIDKYITNSQDGVNWIKIGDTKGITKYLYSTKQKITKEGARQSRFVKENDVILSNSMSFGNPFIMKTQGYIHDGWFVLRLPEYLDSEYFYYLITSPSVQEQIQSLASGAIVKNISGDLVKKVNLSFPKNISEQKRIVEILDEAFVAIDKAKANVEKNLQNAKELFESYLQKVFTEIRVKYEMHSLSNYLNLITYGFTNPMPTADFGPYMVTAKDVKEGIVNYNTARKTLQEAFDNLLTDKSRPRKGDVLLTKDGTLGRLAVVSEANLCINQSVALLRPNDQINSYYLKYLLSSKFYQELMIAQAGGATIKHIYITRVDKMLVPVPPISIQHDANNKVNKIREKTKALEKIYQNKLNDLEELKKSILQKAFNGELTEKQIDQIADVIL
jgi:type I restriction enzyme S subunit